MHQFVTRELESWVYNHLGMLCYLLQDHEYIAAIRFPLSTLSLLITSTKKRTSEEKKTHHHDDMDPRLYVNLDSSFFIYADLLGRDLRERKQGLQWSVGGRGGGSGQDNTPPRSFCPAAAAASASGVVAAAAGAGVLVAALPRL